MVSEMTLYGVGLIIEVVVGSTSWMVDGDEVGLIPGFDSDCAGDASLVDSAAGDFIEDFFADGGFTGLEDAFALSLLEADAADSAAPSLWLGSCSSLMLLVFFFLAEGCTFAADLDACLLGRRDGIVGWGSSLSCGRRGWWLVSVIEVELLT